MDFFKYLDRGVSVEKFRDVFREEVKFGQQVFELGRVHHDVDGLRLSVEGKGETELEVLLKKRDPETEWEDWVKDGHEIAREWVTAFRFDDMPAEKALYYNRAFEVLDEFQHGGRFPGGKTRSTKKKLELTEIPRFDPTADLEPLVELAVELRDVKDEIQELDRQVDEWVYELYKLNADERDAVEGA
jgi:hypothetical protein